MAAGVGPGDAVFTTPFTFIATAEVVSLLGPRRCSWTSTRPPSTWTRPRWLRATPRPPLPQAAKGLAPRAVLPVNLFGLPTDYEAINAIAAKHGMFVLEDAAQGFGGEYKGRRAGSLATAGATSFFPAKPLGCYGDGGAAFTDDAETAKVMKSLRVHGQGGNKYDNVRVGLNARLDTLQAAVLLAKLEVFPQELAARRRAADAYARELGDAVGQRDGACAPRPRGISPWGVMASFAMTTCPQGEIPFFGGGFSRAP